MQSPYACLAAEHNQCEYRLYFAVRYGTLILSQSRILGKKAALC